MEEEKTEEMRKDGTIMYKPELFWQEAALLGEGPLWDDRSGTFYFVDIEGRTLNRCGMNGGGKNQCRFSQRVSAAFLSQSGKVLAALEDGIYLLDEEEEPVLFAPNPERPALPRNRFNDGKCDRLGRMWVGTMDMDAKPGRAALYCVEKDGACSKKIGGVSISNGLCWSRDDRFLYYVDTPSQVLWRYDFDLETGALSNRVGLIDYSGEQGNFDGMTMDAQGNLWIAHWGGFQVSCWDPLTGKKLGQVDLPVPNISCCTFAGEKLDRLVITTAVGRDPAVKRDYPLSGSVYVCGVDAVGTPAFRFGL